MSDPVRPFHSGSQDCQWQHRNCFRCRKYDHLSDTSECDIDRALLAAWAGDGTVPAEIAERMGANRPHGYTWDCPEKETQ